MHPAVLNEPGPGVLPAASTRSPARYLWAMLLARLSVDLKMALCDAPPCAETRVARRAFRVFPGGEVL